MYAWLIYVDVHILEAKFQLKKLGIFNKKWTSV